MKRDRVVLLLSYILAYELRTTFTGPNLESHKTSVHWDHITATASLSFWKRVCSFLWYERDTNFVKWQSISLQCNIYMYHLPNSHVLHIQYFTTFSIIIWFECSLIKPYLFFFIFRIREDHILKSLFAWIQQWLLSIKKKFPVSKKFVKSLIKF